MLETGVDVSVVKTDEYKSVKTQSLVQMTEGRFIQLLPQPLAVCCHISLCAYLVPTECCNLCLGTSKAHKMQEALCRFHGLMSGFKVM